MIAAGPAVPWQVKYVALAGIWGSSFLLMKLGLRALSPLQIAGLRVLCGSVVLAAWCTSTKTRLVSGWGTWGHLFVSGVFLISLPFVLFAAADERVSSALAGIGNSVTPLATVVLSLLFLPSETVTRRKITGVVAGFAGVVVILQPWQHVGRPDLLGFGMTLVAGSCYGVGWVYNRRFLGGRDLGGLAQPTAQLLVGLAQLLVVVLAVWVVQRDLPPPWLPAEPAGDLLGPVLAVVALGAVGTGLAYAFQFDVVRAAGPTVASTVTYLNPVVSIVLGVVLLQEEVTWPQLVGGAIVITSAVVTQRGASPSSAAEEPGRLDHEPDQTVGTR